MGVGFAEEFDEESHRAIADEVGAGEVAGEASSLVMAGRGTTLVLASLLAWGPRAEWTVSR